MKGLYYFNWDCGRMGDLEGLLIADSKEIKDALGQEVYFGEVLGKHSEIYGTLEEKDFDLKSTDEVLLIQLEELFEGVTICGWNPLLLLEEEAADA